MFKSFVSGAAVVAAAGIAPHCAAATTGSTGPSFRCGKGLNPVERLICADAELSAFDRAMALAYSTKRRSAARLAEQRFWLQKRNACSDRSCVKWAYEGWFRDFEWVRLGPRLRRRVSPLPDGSELLLATFVSPSNKVDPLGDSGNLTIRSVGGGWYLFRASSVFTYDPHDGHGPNISTSEAHGVVRLSGRRGSYVEDSDEKHSCRLEFTQLRRGAWKLIEKGGCSGLGSSLGGIYRQ